MPRGKTNKSSTTGRRYSSYHQTRYNQRYDSPSWTDSPSHRSNTSNPNTCPIRNEMRAELDAQRAAASPLPGSAQLQDPHESVTSPSHLLGPQQHPSQHQISPTGMSQQQHPSLQHSQAALPIAQTVQPPQWCPAQGISTVPPSSRPQSSLLSSVPLTPHQPSAPLTSQLPQSSYGSGLILSPAEAPVPQKIVDKIRSGQFVEMRELLADNISLLEQFHSIHTPGNMSLAGPSRPHMRDILTLPSWLYYFLTYRAILQKISSPTPADDPRGLSSRTPRLAGLRSLFPATSCCQLFIALEHTLSSTS